MPATELLTPKERRRHQNASDAARRDITRIETALDGLVGNPGAAADIEQHRRSLALKRQELTDAENALNQDDKARVAAAAAQEADRVATYVARADEARRNHAAAVIDVWDKAVAFADAVSASCETAETLKKLGPEQARIWSGYLPRLQTALANVLVVQEGGASFVGLKAGIGAAARRDLPSVELAFLDGGVRVYPDRQAAADAQSRLFARGENFAVAPRPDGGWQLVEAALVFELAESAAAAMQRLHRQSAGRNFTIARCDNGAFAVLEM